MLPNRSTEIKLATKRNFTNLNLIVHIMKFTCNDQSMLGKWLSQYRNLFRDVFVHLALLSTSDFHRWYQEVMYIVLVHCGFVTLDRKYFHLILEHVSTLNYLLGIIFNSTTDTYYSSFIYSYILADILIAGFILNLIYQNWLLSKKCT